MALQEQKYESGFDMNDPFPYGKFEPTHFMQRLITITSGQPDTWFGRRMSFFLRSFAILLLGNKPVDIERCGAKMRLYPRRNFCEKRVLFTPQYCDHEELDILESYIKQKDEEFCFIDIGANIGAYSLFAAGCAHKGARILAVEPQPVIFERLIYNIQQNSQGYIKAVGCAVADKTGEITLFINHRDRGRSSIRIVDTASMDSVRVPAVTLLDLLDKEGISRTDIVKLDVQGAEDIILTSFFRDAPKSLYPELIIIEDKDGLENPEMPALLVSKGYECLKRIRTKLIYRKGKGHCDENTIRKD